MPIVTRISLGNVEVIYAVWLDCEAIGPRIARNQPQLHQTRAEILCGGDSQTLAELCYQIYRQGELSKVKFVNRRSRSPRV